jgi:hypothetical protein
MPGGDGKGGAGGGKGENASLFVRDGSPVFHVGDLAEQPTSLGKQPHHVRSECAAGAGPGSLESTCSMLDPHEVVSGEGLELGHGFLDSR